MARKFDNQQGQLLNQGAIFSDETTFYPATLFKTVRLNSPSDLGLFIKSIRKAKGLTQQQFADLSGVGRRFVVECEAGKPRLEFAKVLQVAAAAGIDIVAHKR